MMTIRKSNERGFADHGWLQARHTFSFANYFDPSHMGFKSLRVINQDQVAPGEGFGTHGHNDMEIITYIIEGKLEHKDSMGNGSIIEPGDVQYMSAGTGVRHSEFNPSPTEKVHLMQIWILPDKAGYEPTYDQKTFSKESRKNTLKKVVGPVTEKNQSVIGIRQDVHLYASLLESGKTLEHTLAPGRGAWLQLIKGQLQVNGGLLSAGDALRIEKESSLKIEALEDAEFLLFDLK